MSDKEVQKSFQWVKERAEYLAIKEDITQRKITEDASLIQKGKRHS